MRNLSLLLAAVVLTACSGASGSAPDLPQSVSPGWSRKALTAEPNDCWQAEYAGPGSANVSVCRYATEAVAFDAVQRTRAEADTVKFQEGRYFVLVHWKDAGRAEITALVRAIQASLKA